MLRGWFDKSVTFWIYRVATIAVSDNDHRRLFWHWSEIDYEVKNCAPPVQWKVHTTWVIATAKISRIGLWIASSSNKFSRFSPMLLFPVFRNLMKWLVGKRFIIKMGLFWRHRAYYKYQEWIKKKLLTYQTALVHI